MEARILRVVGVAKEHDDGRRAILFGGGDEAFAGLIGVAGFDADGVLVQAGFGIGVERIDELIRVLQQTRLGVQVGRFDRIAGGADDFAERFVLERIGRELCHVARGGIVVVVMYAMGIDKMRARHAQLGGFGVHAIGKSADGTGQMHRNSRRGVVAGYEHQPVQEIPQADRFTDLKAHQRAMLGKALFDLLADGEGRVEVAAFEREHARHDLRGAGGKRALIGQPLVEHLTGVAAIRDDHLWRRHAGIIIVGKRGGGQRGQQRQRQQDAQQSFFHL